jgi:PleD family two-component response regulator
LLSAFCGSHSNFIKILYQIDPSRAINIPLFTFGGLASFPRDGETIEQLFQQADKALLEAKRSGKNRIYLVGKPQSDITEID